MSKSLQYVKVFEVLQNAKGPVSVSDVKAIPGIVSSRLSTYLWEIKKNTGYAVKSNRDGRAVVSYELVGSGTAPVAKTVTKVTKTPKAVAKSAPIAKVAKVTKAKKAPAIEMENDALPAVMKDSQVFDALDTFEVDAEDRAFASAYVKGM